MKRLINTETLDIFPYGNGFIYAEKISLPNGKIKINYFLYNFNTDTISPFTKNAYLLSKYGNAFKEISEQLSNYITCDVARMANDKTVVVYNTGEAGMFDHSGNLIWTDDLSYHDFSVKNIVGDGNHFWCAVPNDNSIIRYQIKSMSVDLRMGSINSKCFDKPQSLWKDKDEIYVCNAGSFKITVANVRDFTVRDYLKFEEPIWKYLKINEHELVMLNSGIYKI